MRSPKSKSSSLLKKKHREKGLTAAAVLSDAPRVGAVTPGNIQGTTPEEATRAAPRGAAQLGQPLRAGPQPCGGSVVGRARPTQVSGTEPCPATWELPNVLPFPRQRVRTGM